MNRRAKQEKFADDIGVGGIEHIATLHVRLIDGTLPPALETYLLALSMGKPSEHVEIDVTHKHSLEGKSIQELAFCALEIHKKLSSMEPKALIDVTPIEVENV